MNDVVFEAKNLKKYFYLRKSLKDTLQGKPGPIVHAVDDVSLQLKKAK